MPIEKIRLTDDELDEIIIRILDELGEAYRREYTKYLEEHPPKLITIEDLERWKAQWEATGADPITADETKTLISLYRGLDAHYQEESENFLKPFDLNTVH